MQEVVQSRVSQATQLMRHPAKLIPIAMLSLAMLMAMSWTSNSHSTPTPLGNDDAEFVFAGRCPNGEKYRIFAYTQTFEGQPASFYDYEGPAGKGTVRSNTTPRTLAVRVCRKLAEIIDDH